MIIKEAIIKNKCYCIYDHGAYNYYFLHKNVERLLLYKVQVSTGLAGHNGPCRPEQAGASARGSSPPDIGYTESFVHNPIVSVLRKTRS